MRSCRPDEIFVASDGMQDQLIVQKERTADYLLVSFVGARLDPANCAVLRDELQAETNAHPQDMVIDLSGIEYAVSPAVNVILDMHEHCREAGRMLILIRPRAAVRRILSLSGVTAVLAVRDSIAGARELLASRQS